jgi:hypothetical protein
LECAHAFRWEIQGREGGEWNIKREDSNYECRFAGRI